MRAFLDQPGYYVRFALIMIGWVVIVAWPIKEK